MNLYKKLSATFIFCFAALYTFGQTPATPASQPTGIMNADGKIYVVVAVILVILAGLFLYLFNLDRKLSKLEKNNKTA